MDELLPKLEKEHRGRIKIEKYPTDDIDLYRDLIKYEKQYGSEENEATKLFVGESYLAGAGPISSKAEELVRAELDKGSSTFSPRSPAEQAARGTTPSPEPEGVPQAIVERFRSFSPFAVAGAGFVDGINPCAFTTIIFLLSVLTLLGKTRRDILSVGVAFTVAVFCAYLLIGLGALKAIKVFSVSHKVFLGVTYGAAGMAFLLGALSLVDYFRYRASGDAKDISLKLPHSVRLLISKMIRQRLSVRNLVAGSLVLGFTVSVLEAMCTGQVYLPTIVFVQRDASLRVHALGYLLLYNLMFILPLAAIFLCAYMGMRSERLSGFLRRHLGLFKLALAALFLLLGAALLLNTATV